MTRRRHNFTASVAAGTLNSMARSAARAQREREIAARKLAQEKLRHVHAAEREAKLQAKNDRQQYLVARAEEAEDSTNELQARIESLSGILSHSLTVNDTISFASLRMSEAYEAQPVPQELVTLQHPPTKTTFFSAIKKPSFVQNALGLNRKYKQALQAAKAQHALALKAWEAAEAERLKKLAEFEAKQDQLHCDHLAAVQARNREIDELEAGYTSGDIQAVIAYNSMVLERSEYPDDFPQSFRVAYDSDSKELVVDYQLPDVEVVPTIAEFKYNKTKDVIEARPRKSAEVKDLYQDIVASVALRTIHEIFEADQGNHIALLVFSGYVCAVDPATGGDIRPYIISARATRAGFANLNLARVDKRACLRNLGAQVSPQPHAMQPVKPVIEFDMVDKRFIEQVDVLSDLESRPNLMDLSPAEFEALVSNLFSKMGLETKLTRSSRDGGVDAVAYDTRPILGGKVVIQAKRYKNTVGVSAVRDLYGTMLNEGANKGIIVSTASYGPDAYEFAKDKPLELIDGGVLLYHLEQVGTKARIVMPDDGIH